MPVLASVSCQNEIPAPPDHGHRLRIRALHVPPRIVKMSGVGQVRRDQTNAIDMITVKAE